MQFVEQDISSAARICFFKNLTFYHFFNNKEIYDYVFHFKPIFCKLHAGLQFVGQSWTAALRVADETCDALDCLVDNAAISNLIGFTPREAQVYLLHEFVDVKVCEY